MEKLNIVVVGLVFGRIVAEEIARGAGAQYCNLYGLCDSRPEQLEFVASQHSAKRFPSLDAVLADPEVKAVALITGPNGRAKLIEKIIRSGRDVMTTKPFESDPREAVRVLELAKSLGRIVHINSPSPVPTEDIALIQQWRKELGLGRVIAARGEVHRLDVQKADGRWIDDPAACPAAPLTRIGIYMINDLVRIFGRAKKAGVITSKIFTGRPTPDNAQLSILFENGGMANVFASFSAAHTQGQGNSLTVNFENGIIYRNISPFKSRCEGEGPVLAVNVSIKGKPPLVESRTVGQGSGGYPWKEFHHAVHGGKLENEITPDEVAESVRILNAMALSEKTGKFEDIIRLGQPRAGC